MFAGGIAHDFNNLLAVIFGCCERQLVQKDLPPEARKYTNGAGNLLTQNKLGSATTLAADTIPARQSTLQVIEATTGRPAITYADQTFDLFDYSRHEDGAMEPDGTFGNPLTNLFNMEGHYAFRAVATYGQNGTATREALWSLYVDVAVDPHRRWSPST